MKAQDIMTKKVYAVKQDDSVSKAVNLICKNNIAGLPVVDEEGKVVGVVSEKDLLSKMYPGYDEFQRDPVGSMDFEKMELNYYDVSKLKVKEVMSKPPITATPDTPVLKIGSMMILNKIRRIPIVNEAGKLVGIVSQGDIHRSVFHCYLPVEAD